MKRVAFLLVAVFTLIEITGCGGGIEPGFASPPAGVVVVPPPAEKPVNYGMQPLSGMRR